MSKTNLTLDLRNIDSNAFALIGQAQRTLRYNGMSDLIEEFRTEATSGDYSHLLCTLADWFDLELAGDEDEDDEYDFEVQECDAEQRLFPSYQEAG